MVASNSDAEGAQPGAARPKVVYVMGSGHSGSTILGVALGNCAGWFYAGELQNFLSRAGTAGLGGLERTRFWGRVRDAVPEATELFGYGALTLIERSGSLLRVHQWPRRRRLRRRYREVTERSLQVVAQTAQASHVVDSSHFPLRAKELQSLPGIELYLIFLVRDPQRVVASINRMLDRHEPLRSLWSTVRRNLDLWLTYGLSAWVFLRQPPERRIFVRYEDFLAAPQAVLAQIIAGAGSSAAVPDLEHLSTGLPIHANRLIRQETVALKAKEARLDRGSPITAVMQRPSASLFARMRPAARREALGGRR